MTSNVKIKVDLIHQTFEITAPADSLPEIQQQFKSALKEFVEACEHCAAMNKSDEATQINSDIEAPVQISTEQEKKRNTEMTADQRKQRRSIYGTN